MRKLGYVRIAFAVLGIATFAESQIDRAQAQSYTARSVVAECQKCLDEDVEQNRKLGKHATAIALATALGCLITGPGAAVCFAAVDVAVLGQMMVDISDGSGPECKAHYKACTEMWAALEKKEYTNCELPDPGTKLVKTLTICRNGFGTTRGLSCNAPHAGTPTTSPACANLRCPISNKGC